MGVGRAPGTSSTAAAIAQAVAMQAAPRHAHLPADDEVHAVVAVKALASEGTAGPVEVLQWVPLCPRSNASRPRLVHGVKAPARSPVKYYHDIEAHLLKNANGSASAHKNTTAASEAARTRTPLRVPAAAACEQDLRQAESSAEILPRCSCCAVKPACQGRSCSRCDRGPYKCTRVQLKKSSITHPLPHSLSLKPSLCPRVTSLHWHCRDTDKLDYQRSQRSGSRVG